MASACNSYGKRVYRAISRSSARKSDNARNPMRRPRCGMPFCCCVFDLIHHSYDRNTFQRSLPGKWRPVLACDSVNLTGGLHSKIHDDRRIDEKYGFLDPLLDTFIVRRFSKPIGGSLERHWTIMNMKLTKKLYGY